MVLVTEFFLLFFNNALTKDYSNSSQIVLMSFNCDEFEYC